MKTNSFKIGEVIMDIYNAIGSRVPRSKADCKSTCFKEKNARVDAPLLNLKRNVLRCRMHGYFKKGWKSMVYICFKEVHQLRLSIVIEEDSLAWSWFGRWDLGPSEDPPSVKSV